MGCTRVKPRSLRSLARHDGESSLIAQPAGSIVGGTDPSFEDVGEPTAAQLEQGLGGGAPGEAALRRNLV